MNDINWDAILIGAAVKSCEQIADAIVDQAQRLAPHSTGELRNSIKRGPVLVKDTEVWCEFGAYSPHAAHQEWGTAGRSEIFGNVSPDLGAFGGDWGGEALEYKTAKILYDPKHPDGFYWIPKNPPMPEGKWLSWVDDEQGRVYKKQVQHPGVYPQPFMRPSIDLIRVSEASLLIQKNFNEALSTLRGEFDAKSE